MTAQTSVYEMSFNLRVTWQAHSLSNAGSNGSNRLMPRRQLLADGTETDACSGDIEKHYHAALLTEYCAAQGISLCSACAKNDARRILALIDQPNYKSINIKQVLKQCAVCDTHGFMVTTKKTTDKEEGRQGLSKHSLIEFALALALPDRHSSTEQISTRGGEGQMIMKKTARSGEYAVCARYKCVGIGVDTDTWVIAIEDEQERLRRYRAGLLALRDQLLSPSGAMTSTMLPHLTGLSGSIVLRTSAGRAFMYSPLVSGFQEILQMMAKNDCQVQAFNTVNEFHDTLNNLIEDSYPAIPPKRQTLTGRASTKRNRPGKQKINE